MFSKVISLSPPFGVNVLDKSKAVDVSQEVAVVSRRKDALFRASAL